MYRKGLKDFLLLISLNIYIALYQYFYTFVRLQVSRTYETKNEMIYIICTMLIYGIVLSYIGTREYAMLSLILVAIILVIQVLLRLHRREVSLLIIYLGFVIYEIFKKMKSIGL